MQRETTTANGGILAIRSSRVNADDVLTRSSYGFSDWLLRGQWPPECIGASSQAGRPMSILDH